jgi:hypothetical protein
MQRVEIGRWKNHEGQLPEGLVDGVDEYEAWITGTRDDGSGWIMWFDTSGSPVRFFGNLDDLGGGAAPMIDLRVID